MRRIVVGVDGSEHGDAALAFAAEEARLRGAELEVLLAWPPVLTTGHWVPVEEESSPLKEPMELLDEVVRRVLGPEVDVPIVRSTPLEAPAPALLEASGRADLLVVGSRGRGGFKGLLLGSVGQQCVVHAHCPVVIVPAPRRHLSGPDLPVDLRSG
jgi:nucleotide-binding universal stress UspA family protein